MKRRSAWLSFAACALTAAAHCPSVKAAAPALRPASLQMVGCANGITGFYEQSTGRLYLYDAKLMHCVGVRQIGRLGETLASVSPPDGQSPSRAPET
jgi:hypothetical protein